jgi:hypothetical protein
MMSSSDIPAVARDVVVIFEWDGWATYIALNSVIAKAARIAGFHILDIGASFVAGRWIGNLERPDVERSARFGSTQRNLNDEHCRRRGSATVNADFGIVLFE